MREACSSIVRVLGRRLSASEGARWIIVGGIVACLLLGPGVASAQLNQTMHYDGWILAAARAPGLHGSIWRTDLWLNLLGMASDAEVTLYFCRLGDDNSGVEGIPVPLDFERWQRTYYFEDVVGSLLGVTGGSWVGAIHYASNVPIQASARVYSISADGRASYGQLVEGIPTADMSPDDDPWNSREHQWMFAAKHTADGRFRVNVGIVNPTSVEASYTVQMFDSTGNDPGGEPAHVSVTVPPMSMVQLSDPFAGVAGGEWSDMLIRTICQTEGGGTFSYASVVDNATNDAYFLRGVKLLFPDE